MKELLFETNRELYYSHFHINANKFFYKRLLASLVFFLVYVILILRVGNLWWLLGIPIVMIVGFKLPYLELISKKNKEDIIKQYEFPSFLRYFISLLSTHGNVYQTLKATIPYVHEPVKTELKRLVEKLEENKINNRDAFMEFAESIGSSEAYMIMSMLYEFNEEGISKEDIKELENTVNNLQENKINELIEYKVNKMGKYADPVLVIGILYIILFTGITLASFLTSIKF